MNPEEIKKYRIIDIRLITHNTRQFRIEVPDGNFNFLPGDFVKAFPEPVDPLEYRPYTPTSTPDTKDRFELIIKRYEIGPTSRYMHERKVGDIVHISGPHDGGHFAPGMARHVGMVAGGTGITPMISIIRTVLSRGYDVDISLIFANKSVEDIILKDEFDRYARECGNFKRYYVVDKAPHGWEMGEGRINTDIMRTHLPPPSDDTIVFLCGPPMMEIEFRKKLAELGYAKDKIIVP
jgi:cytochrome-b5 reductase